MVELAALALAGGHISAARTAYGQAIECNPRDATARIGLGNLFRDEGRLDEARQLYLAALATPAIAIAVRAAAQQGLATVFEALGKAGLAESYRQLGFTSHAVVTKPYRGQSDGVALLLLVSARNGNIPLHGWIDDQHFAVTAIYAEFYEPAGSLPPHALVVNAIGDAELCSEALDGAEAILKRSAAPVINPPARIRATSRAGNAQRLGCLPGVIAPKMQALPRLTVLETELEYPLLVRAPGYHTGKYFLRVDHPQQLAAAIDSIPGNQILIIQYLDASGADGLARKYRVIFVDGKAYPLHLAISPDWKVHYFTAAMAKNAAHRHEEKAFLTDMRAVLGNQAMAAIEAINQALGLDYAGIDFAIDRSGRLLLFEANATMAIIPPDADPIWDYRRLAVGRALDARAEMLRSRIK